MRPRNISKLHYQFGHYAKGLSNNDLALALETKGLIEMIDLSRSRYIETKAMRSIDPSKFDSVIGAILQDYANKPPRASKCASKEGEKK
jgi:hypothetical protein